MGLKRGMPGSGSGANALLSAGHKQLTPTRADLHDLATDPAKRKLTNYSTLTPADVSGAGSVGLNINAGRRW